MIKSINFVSCIDWFGYYIWLNYCANCGSVTEDFVSCSYVSVASWFADVTDLLILQFADADATVCWCWCYSLLMLQFAGATADITPFADST